MNQWAFHRLWQTLIVGEAGKFIALIKTAKFQEATELRVTEHRLNLVQPKLVVRLVMT